MNQGRRLALVLFSVHMGQPAMIKIFLRGLKPQKAMTERGPYEDFTCPKCGAQYKLVRVRAPSDTRDPPLHCKICNQEFAPTDGENILKYFLVGRRRRSRPASAHGGARA